MDIQSPQLLQQLQFVHSTLKCLVLARLDLTFEMIQHRFTKPAKRVIQENYPMTKLELDESKRKMKWGRYGIYKYVYQDKQQEVIKDTIGGYINHFFPEAKIEYFT